MRWTLVAGALLAARPLVGQVPHEREGLWGGFGVGYGSYHHTCERCDRPRGDAGMSAGYLAVGWAVNRRVNLGLELASGALAQGVAITGTSLIGTCYPWVDRGLFLRGGVGTSSYKQPSYAEFPPFRGSGHGWLAALGWDVRVDRRLSFTPMVTFRAGAPGTVGVLVDTVATNLRQRSVALTLGLTFH